MEVSDEQTMLWSRREDQRRKEPEHQLLDAIANGELDEHLVAIADAVHARRQLLEVVRAAGVLAELCVGDSVMFNHHVRPRYLEHEGAVITAIDDHWLTVRLWRPVGRFREGNIRCSPLAVTKLGTGSSPQ